MKNTMKYYRKNVYGNELMYLADPVQKEAIELISSRRSITQRDMMALNMIGFVFEEITETQAKCLDDKN